MGDSAWPHARPGGLPEYDGGGPLAIPFTRSRNLGIIIVGEGPRVGNPSEYQVTRTRKDAVVD